MTRYINFFLYVVFVLILIIPIVYGSYNASVKDTGIEWVKINFSPETSTTSYLTSTAPPYLYDLLGVVYFNESKMNATIDARVSSGNAKTGTGYLYNDTTYMYLNESQLNDTIDARTGVVAVEGKVNSTAWKLVGLENVTLQNNNYNVSIGTSSSAYKLTVDGQTRLMDTDWQLRLTHSAGGWLATDFNVDVNGDLTITPQGGETTLTHNASVTNRFGVGTTTPDYKLEVEDTGNAYIAVKSTANSAAIFRMETSTTGYHFEGYQGKFRIVETGVDYPIVVNDYPGKIEISRNVTISNWLEATGDINSSQRICDRNGCIGFNNTDTWNTTSDFADDFVNITGDTMTGNLNISQELYVYGNTKLFDDLELFNEQSPSTIQMRGNTSKYTRAILKMYDNLTSDNYWALINRNVSALPILSYLMFERYNGTHWIQPMRIYPQDLVTYFKDEGVGIGVYSPQYELDVEGDIALTKTLIFDNVGENISSLDTGYLKSESRTGLQYVFDTNANNNPTDKLFVVYNENESATTELFAIMKNGRIGDASNTYTWDELNATGSGGGSAHTAVTPWLYNDSSTITFNESFFNYSVIELVNGTELNGSNYYEIQPENVFMHSLPGASYNNLHNLFDVVVGSAGRIDGGMIIKNPDQTINVTGGSGMIRQTDDDLSTVYFINWTNRDNIPIPTDSIVYIGIDYNNSEPFVVNFTNVVSWDLDTNFPLGSIINQKDDLYILNNPWWVGDGLTNIIERFQAQGTERDDSIGGLILGVTGTRNPTLTAGTLWSRLNEFEISAKDCSVADTIYTFWRDGSGGWERSSQQSDYNVTHYDDNSGTLQTLQNNWYANWWVFIEIDSANNGQLMFIYPQNQYSTSSSAEAEEVPVFPSTWYKHGLLIGRVLIKEGTDTPIEVQSVFTTQFTAAQASDHGNLAGLSDDDHPQYGFRLNVQYINETQQADNTTQASLISTLRVDNTTQAAEIATKISFSDVNESYINLTNSYDMNWTNMMTVLDVVILNNLTVQDNISAKYFHGNGSQLTSITYSETDPQVATLDAGAERWCKSNAAGTSISCLATHAIPNVQTYKNINGTSGKVTASAQGNTLQVRSPDDSIIFGLYNTALARGDFWNFTYNYSKYDHEFTGNVNITNADLDLENGDYIVHGDEFAFLNPTGAGVYFESAGGASRIAWYSTSGNEIASVSVIEASTAGVFNATDYLGQVISLFSIARSGNNICDDMDGIPDARYDYTCVDCVLSESGAASTCIATTNYRNCICRTNS